MTKAQATRAVTMRKSGGNDRYSWAVFVHGREKWNGMDRNEASWRRREEIAALTTEAK